MLISVHCSNQVKWTYCLFKSISILEFPVFGVESVDPDQTRDFLGLD